MKDMFYDMELYTTAYEEHQNPHFSPRYSLEKRQTSITMVP